MKKALAALIAITLLISGCSVIQKLTEGSGSSATTAEGFGTSRQSDLAITPVETSATVEWGVVREIPIEVTWAAGQKFAVQLAAAAETPEWLGVEFVPAIIEPPGRSILRVNPTVADATLGETMLVIEASAYGMSEPVRQKITLDVRRQSGDFEHLEAAPLTRECRNVCGKVDKGVLTFYDILREKDQECSDDAKLPASQQIGIQNFGLASPGYGFGRTCRVAAIFERGGTLSFFNLGLTGKLPRGALMLSVRGATDGWLSPDNTLAVLKVSGGLVPYDVVTGQMLARSCRITRDPSYLSLAGISLTSDNCQWEVK
ncbi:hypothetical protein KKH27_09730 [bacterium]|nr:hypothetical protein [bacterium]MBU1984134.1 hypothetical protein [bacterium]